MKLRKINIVILLLSIISISAGTLVAQAEVNSTSSINKLKAKIEKPFEKNRDIRNTEIKNLRASTTAQIRQIRTEDKKEIKNIRASSTAMFKEIKGEKKIIAKNMQLREFEIRKNSLVRELNNALKNLDNINGRINTRIASSTASGRDMTEAKVALIIAENKLATAKTVVGAFASSTYASSTVSTGTTTNVTLDRPRKEGDTAIKVVKDARDSFKIVVEAIAHNMGLGNRKDDNSTTTTTN